LLYAEFCERVIVTQSKLFFETFFFRPLLELSNDRVAAVRIRVAEVLPQVGRVFSGEEMWSSEVADAVQRLEEDQDQEVRERATAASREMAQKEYWEAAKQVEAEELVKLRLEAEQEEREIAVSFL
jgi:hypothetical protein